MSGPQRSPAERAALEARLMQLYASDLSILEIAKASGVSKGVASGILYRLRVAGKIDKRPEPLAVVRMNEARQRSAAQPGAASPRWTEDAEAELRQLWAAGLSVRVICERMDRSRTSVTSKAHRMGLVASEVPERRSDGPGVRPAVPLGITFRACQYIAGTPTADDACKCRKKPLPGKPYCKAHAKLCFVERGEREESTYAPKRQRLHPHGRFEVAA